MISALAGYENATAVGILARAAIAVDDDANPAAKTWLPEETRLREAIFSEVRRSLGVPPDDESADTRERLGDAIDREVEALAGTTNVNDVLQKLAQKGEAPADLYEVEIIENVRDVYEKRWFDEYKIITSTVSSADQEQHFGDSNSPDLPNFISLFAKSFPNKYPYRSFTMLAAGQREGLKLVIHQAWRIYADQVDVREATDLVDMLRKFSNEYGIEFDVNGVRGKFVLNAELPDLAGAIRHIHVLPVFTTDSRGRKKEKAVKFMLSNFYLIHADRTASAALTVAIDLDKYRATLESHGW